MLKIGFIDYYLDEWHANNYPQMIKNAAGDRYEVAYAYGMIDSPKGITNKEWAQKFNVELLDSIEEVTEKSDRIIVLSPDNPEMHEELCKIPLRSQKLVYVDKTFATDKETAERIFANAHSANTKCYSSSALRFASELKDIDKDNINAIYSEGPGVYEIYSIHQIEPIVSLMNCRAKRVMFTGTAKHPSMIIEFCDGRRAYMHQSQGIPFRICIDDKENKGHEYKIASDFFALFIENLIKFFDTGVVPVDYTQTIDIIAIREKGLQAIEKPFEWVYI